MNKVFPQPSSEHQNFSWEHRKMVPLCRYLSFLPVVLIIVLTSLLVSFAYAINGRITQEQLLQVGDPAKIDVSAVRSIEIKSWMGTQENQSYSAYIHSDFAYNEIFVKATDAIAKTYQKHNNDGKRRAEIRLNRLANSYHDLQVLLSSFRSQKKKQMLKDKLSTPQQRIEWFELKNAMLIQYNRNLSAIFYNAIERKWAVCAWVENWKTSNSPELTTILAAAPSHLRICCMHYLLGDTPIVRKPLLLLDYIPLEFLYIISRNRLGADFHKKATSPFIARMVESYHESMKSGNLEDTQHMPVNSDSSMTSHMNSEHGEGLQDTAVPGVLRNFDDAITLVFDFSDDSEHALIYCKSMKNKLSSLIS